MANTRNLSAKFFLSGRSSLVDHAPGILTSQSEKFFFFITFETQQKLMREHIQLLEVHSFVTVWASQVVLVVKNPPVNAGDVRDVGLIPGWGRSPGVGNANPLQ